ncbi:MAG: hypothetical protein H6736_00805 [Alphaproteobacteria bacterium]|nr:hypothetical protein [Alphaproteobacteria bacterium]
MRSRTSELLLLAALGCRDPETPPVPYVDLVTQPCALDPDGRVTCWAPDDTGLPEPWVRDIPDDLPPLVSIQSHRPGLLRGLDADGRVVVVACADTPWVACPTLPEPVVQLTDYGGLTADGVLVPDVNHDLTLDAPAGPWVVLADSHPAGVDTARRLWVHGAPDLTVDLPVAPTAIVADVHRDRAGACVLDGQGTIHCAGTAPFTGWATDPPYRALVGSLGAACALKNASTLVCNDGTVHDFGPVLAFSAARYPYYAADGSFVERYDAPVTVCALPEDGGIVCEGPRTDGLSLD